jgi:hypothetical protein
MPHKNMEKPKNNQKEVKMAKKDKMVTLDILVEI